MRRIKTLLLISIIITTSAGIHYAEGGQKLKQYPGDRIIHSYDPPNSYYNIKGGSCGEACLWSILQNKNITVSQKTINIAGGNPGRGLHSSELFTVLKHFNIRYYRIPGRVRSYQDHLQSKIIGSLKKGRPVLLGVKVYPDSTPAWACDHFILVVGFNAARKEMIYNSFNHRYRIRFSKLLNTKKGYSLKSRHKYIFAIAF